MNLPAWLRPAALGERLRQSLFVIPGLSLIVGSVAGEVVVELDNRGSTSWIAEKKKLSGNGPVS